MIVFPIIMIGVLFSAKRRIAEASSQHGVAHAFTCAVSSPWVISIAAFLGIVNIAGTLLRRHTAAQRGMPLEVLDNAYNAIGFNWMRWRLAINQIWPRALQNASLLFMVVLVVAFLIPPRHRFASESKLGALFMGSLIGIVMLIASALLWLSFAITLSKFSVFHTLIVFLAQMVFGSMAIWILSLYEAS